MGSKSPQPFLPDLLLLRGSGARIKSQPCIARVFFCKAEKELQTLPKRPSEKVFVTLGQRQAFEGYAGERGLAFRSSGGSKGWS